MVSHSIRSARLDRLDSGFAQIRTELLLSTLLAFGISTNAQTSAATRPASSAAMAATVPPAGVKAVSL